MLQGALDMLILRSLVIGPAHGHTIAHAIEHGSDRVLQVEHGSLYPALHRLEDRAPGRVVLGHVRKQPQGEVLPADAGGPEDARRRNLALGTAGARHRPGHEADDGLDMPMAWTRFFRRSRRDEDTAREIASYIAIETDDNIARGMTPQAAHDAAVRKFGNATQRPRGDLLDEHRAARSTRSGRTCKYAARLLKRDKGFAAAAILSLALGIGANTAIFQLLDAVRLRTLPVDASRSSW